MKEADLSIPDSLQRNFLLLAVGGVTVLFLWMVGGFLLSLLVAAVTAGITAPVYRKLVQLFGRRRIPAALTVVLGLILLVIGPLSALLAVVVGQAIELTQILGPWIQERMSQPGELRAMIEGLPILSRLPLDTVLPAQERIIESLGKAAIGWGSFAIDGIAAAGRGTVSFVIQLFIFLYAVFFFLLSGRATLDRIIYLSPLESTDEEEIIDRFVSVTRATLRGSILIGGLQGFLMGIGLAVAGVPGAAFWGTIVVVLSVIPGVGAPIVWIPAVIWLVATGSGVAAAGLAVWGGLLVGSVDNLLRPRLVGSDAKMSDLLILISTLGGIGLFGPVGFIVGPIVAAVFVTLWDVYGRAFAHALPEVDLETRRAERTLYLDDGDDGNDPRE